MKWLYSITNSMDMIEEIVEDRGAWHATMQGE